MQLVHPTLERGIPRAVGLDHQQALRRLLAPALPAIDRGETGQHIHAGGEALVPQGAAQREGVFPGGRRHQHHVRAGHFGAPWVTKPAMPLAASSFLPDCASAGVVYPPTRTRWIVLPPLAGAETARRMRTSSPSP